MNHPTEPLQTRNDCGLFSWWQEINNNKLNKTQYTDVDSLGKFAPSWYGGAEHLGFINFCRKPGFRGPYHPNEIEQEWSKFVKDGRTWKISVSMYTNWEETQFYKHSILCKNYWRTSHAHIFVVQDTKDRNYLVLLDKHNHGSGKFSLLDISSQFPLK